MMGNLINIFRNRCRPSRISSSKKSSVFRVSLIKIILRIKSNDIFYRQINWLALKLKVYKCLRTPVQNEPVAISFNEISSIQLDSPQSAANTGKIFKSNA